MTDQGPHQPPPPPPAGHPYAYYPPPRTNSNALASMIVSLVSLVTCPLVGAVGVYLGNKARTEIQATGEQGEGMAQAGIIVGWIAIGLGVLTALFVVGWFVFVIGMFASASTT